MDGLNLVLFLTAAFFGGLTSGVSGFAMGLVVSGVWLHIISPAQNALLIVLCGLVTQGSGIWRVRHAIDWRTVAPFIIGGAVGVPAGTALLKTVDQGTLRLTIGVLLVLYSLYNLIRPAVKPVQGGTSTDLCVGVANGLIGGLTGRVAQPPNRSDARTSKKDLRKQVMSIQVGSPKRVQWHPTVYRASAHRALGWSHRRNAPIPRCNPSSVRGNMRGPSASKTIWVERV
jgi:hypothetical protein